MTLWSVVVESLLMLVNFVYHLNVPGDLVPIWACLLARKVIKTLLNKNGLLYIVTGLPLLYRVVCNHPCFISPHYID